MAELHEPRAIPASRSNSQCSRTPREAACINGVSSKRNLLPCHDAKLLVPTMPTSPESDQRNLQRRDPPRGVAKRDRTVCCAAGFWVIGQIWNTMRLAERTAMSWVIGKASTMASARSSSSRHSVPEGDLVHHYIGDTLPMIVGTQPENILWSH